MVGWQLLGGGMGSGPSIEDIRRAAAMGSQRAMAMLSEIEAGAGPQMNQWIQPAAQQAIETEMQGGMSPEEEAQSRAAIRQDFNTSIGNLSTRGARAGFYSPDSVRTAAMGRPARSLAQGLAALQAKKAQLRREGAAGAGSKLTSLYQFPADEYRQGRQAYGELARRYAGMDMPGGAPVFSSTAKTRGVGGWY